MVALTPFVKFPLDSSPSLSLHEHGELLRRREAYRLPPFRVEERNRKSYQRLRTETVNVLRIAPANTSDDLFACLFRDLFPLSSLVGSFPSSVAVDFSAFPTLKIPSLCIEGLR